MRASKALLVLGCALAGAVCACSSEDPAATGGGGPGGSGGAGGGAGGDGSVCTSPGEVPCSDQAFQALNLQADITPGLITNAADGAGWLSQIDATAGGFGAPDPDSYTYGKFTDTGLVKVEISDENAIDSPDWDIGFRRYVVRLNSRHSGPSCVTAARVPGTPVYDEITAPPDALTFREDDYFTESCDFIPDGSGLDDSPATALSGYWEYPGCVKMTNNVYVVRLAEGRLLKFLVTHYYEAAAQEQCNTLGTVPMPSGAANFQVRWAFLP